MKLHGEKGNEEMRIATSQIAAQHAQEDSRQDIGRFWAWMREEMVR